jgi:hypothetical protein
MGLGTLVLVSVFIVYPVYLFIDWRNAIINDEQYARRLEDRIIQLELKNGIAPVSDHGFGPVPVVPFKPRDN